MEVFLNVCTIQAPRFYHGDIRQEGGRGSVEGCSLCNEQTFDFSLGICRTSSVHHRFSVFSWCGKLTNSTQGLSFHQGALEIVMCKISNLPELWSAGSFSVYIPVSREDLIPCFRTVISSGFPCVRLILCHVWRFISLLHYFPCVLNFWCIFPIHLLTKKNRKETVSLCQLSRPLFIHAYVCGVFFSNHNYFHVISELVLSLQKP